MRIWLVTIGEPLPLPGSTDRAFRSTLLAQHLLERGNTVVWWTSTFDHTKKRQISAHDSAIQVSDGFEIRLLHVPPYRNNLSIERLRNHIELGRRFRHAIADDNKLPDIIVSSYPTIELSYEAAKFGMEKGIPVVLDVRDLWPDVFLDILPAPLRFAGRFALSSLFFKCREALRAASAITGVTEPYVEWALSRAVRPRSSFDTVFPMGYSDAIPDPDAQSEANAYWDNLGIPQSTTWLTVVFFGIVSHHVNLDTVLRAARILERQQKKIRFVICGEGEGYARLASLAEGLTNASFPGWIGRDAIWALMQRASVGLVPYRRTKNFVMNVPNKPIEYMSAGLTLLTSLNEGVLCDLITKHNLGMMYEDDPSSLASVLSFLNDQREECVQMGRNSLLLFREQFTAGRVYSGMSAYLERVATEFKKNQP